MTAYEFKVVPAPLKGEKARGLKTPAERFAFALSQLMNTLGRDGWDYVRADTLPCEERTGFTGRTTVYHNLLVFRRPLPPPAADADAPTPMPQLLSADARMGEAPRIVVHGQGAAPRLGPAAGRDSDFADE